MTSQLRDAGTGRALPLIVLVVLFALLVWPLILLETGATSEAHDQNEYHRPVIDAFARQWPAIDLVNYQSATTPGYHLALALVVRYVSDHSIVLQLINSVATLALLVVLWVGLTRLIGRGWLALFMVCPLLASSYVLGGAIWLTTDNTALLGMAGVLVGVAFTERITPARIMLLSLVATLTILTRQIHLWVAGVLLLTALLHGPLRRLPGGCLPPIATWKVSALLLAIMGCLMPFVVVGVFMTLWGGLTPPAFVDQHASGANPATIPLVLALFGLYGPFFLVLITPTWSALLPRDRLEWAAVVGATVIAILLATSYDKDSGRWGGVLWEVVRRAPVLMDRSVIVPPLCAVGGLVLARLCRSPLVTGGSWQVGVMGIGLLGFVVAQSLNSQAWQRYAEPPVLLFLVLLTALAISPQNPPDPRRALGPGLLAVVLLFLSGVTLYWPALTG